MATITVNRKVFDKLLGKKLSDKEIHEKIPLLAVGVENITKEEMVLEVEPNRPDYLSTQGFARGLSAFLGLQKGTIERIIIYPLMFWMVSLSISLMTDANSN